MNEIESKDSTLQLVASKNNWSKEIYIAKKGSFLDLLKSRDIIQVGNTTPTTFL